MGQEPNIHLGVEDLPRATYKPAAPRRWVPQRPGDLASPDAVPWGGAFGTPAPDVGFAYRIVRELDLPGPTDHRADVEAAVVAVMAARASAIGRSPTKADVAVAVEVLERWGVENVAGIAHDRGRMATLVDSIPPEHLLG